LQQVGDWSYERSSTLAGAPGIFVFKFQAAGAGISDLLLGYKQWWDEKMKTDPTFELTVQVAAPAKTPDQKLGMADKGKTITVNNGARIELALDCNPTTGYTWQVMELNTAVLKQVEDVAFKPSSSAEGAGGTCTFNFDAVGTGASALKLGYDKWWDETSKPTLFFDATLVVNVRPASNAVATTSAGAPALVSLTVQDADKTVEIGQDDTLIVNLPGNATTGYAWGILSNDISVLQPVGDWDYQTQSSAVGAPGTFIFTFKPVTIGTSVLKLGYKRWWDDTSPSEQTFEVTVNISTPITADMPLLLGAPIQLSQGDSGGSIQVDKGQIITVTLNCNRSTGYSWKLLRNNDRVLERMGGSRTSGDEPGAGGLCVRSYRALRKGGSDLKLGYKQWFDDGGKPDQVFQIHVDVGLPQ
jgi:inhibitor of cysteine peptidase